MNLNVRSQNSYFSLRSLPVDVIYHIAQYLTTRELGTMTKVDRYLREVFNSPRLWKDVRVRLPKRKIDPQSLEILRAREIRDLEIFNLNFELETIVLQPFLERLSLRITTVKTLEALTKAASEGHLKLKSLAFGRLHYRNEIQSKVTFLDLFKCLPMLEEVCFGFRYPSGIDEQISVSLTNKTQSSLVVDLQQALCCTGKLLDISLKCFSNVGRSWLKTVILKNPHLQTLSLAGIENFISEGLDDAADPTLCSKLTTFKLTCDALVTRTKFLYETHREAMTTKEILSWAFPGNVAYENLTSLDFSGFSPSILNDLRLKFPSLKKLNLASHVENGKHGFFLGYLDNFPNLEWLELKWCSIDPLLLSVLSDKVGRTLRYLGFGKQQLLKDCHLRDIASMFPVLKTLDLSECEKITDAILVEWYLKHNQSEWPKLRKLVMKGCEGVSQVVVDAVRIKARNQLLIEL